jgi:hypothetical protein
LEFFYIFFFIFTIIKHQFQHRRVLRVKRVGLIFSQCGQYLVEHDVYLWDGTRSNILSNNVDVAWLDMAHGPRRRTSQERSEEVKSSAAEQRVRGRAGVHGRPGAWPPRTWVARSMGGPVARQSLPSGAWRETRCRPTKSTCDATRHDRAPSHSSYHQIWLCTNAWIVLIIPFLCQIYVDHTRFYQDIKNFMNNLERRWPMNLKCQWLVHLWEWCKWIWCSCETRKSIPNTSRKRLKAPDGFLKKPPLEIIFIINFSSFSNDLVWWNDQNKSCRSLKVMKLCSWQFFYLNSFRFSKIESKYVKFKIQILQTISDEKKCQNKSCSTSKVIQLCSWQLFYLNSFTISNKQFTLSWCNMLRVHARVRSVVPFLTTA